MNGSWDEQTRSAARRYPFLAQFIKREASIARWAASRPSTLFIYEFVRFGIKQAWACLFGGVLLALLIATHLMYPADAALSRYDFLVLAAVGDSNRDAVVWA